MSRGKIKRFLASSIPEGFASRQLNDTGFASRQAIGFLKRLWPDVGVESPVNVQAVTGRVTAQLRKLWELNNILSADGEKTRADHRHHAIDALVVACADAGLTHKLSAYWQARDAGAGVRPRLDPPWATIRADAARAVEQINVSHRVRKKISGPLHGEMPLGYTNQTVVRNGTTQGIYVKRMPVEKLSLDALAIGRVEDMSRTAKFVVRDEAVRSILHAHLKAANKPPAKAYPPYPKVSPDGPEIRKVRVLSVQQLGLLVPVANGFADPASNHHISIYRLADGRADFEVVSLYEASRRLARREPVVRRQRGGATFVMSLSSGDTVEFPDGEQRGLWIVQKIASKGQVTFSPINDARPTSEAEAKKQGTTGARAEFAPRVGGLLDRRARKVATDPIGRIRTAGD